MTTGEAARLTTSDLESTDKSIGNECTPYDGPHGLSLLVVGETDLQIVIIVALAAAAPAAAGGPEPGQQRAQRGRQGGRQRGRQPGRLGLQRRGARAALGRHHGLERAAPQPLEHHAVVLLATRRPTPLHGHLKLVEDLVS